MARFTFEGSRSTQPPNTTKDDKGAVNRNVLCNPEDFFFPILDMSSFDQGSGTTYIQMHSNNIDHTDPLYSAQSAINPHTAQLPNVKNIYVKKTYVKAGIEEEFVYDDPENVFCGFGFPRAIVTVASPVIVNSSNYLGNRDSASLYNKISAVAAAEDFAVLAYINNGKINTEVHDALIQLFQHYYGMWLKNGNLGFVSGGAASPVSSPAQPTSGTNVTSDGGAMTPESATFGSFADLKKSPFNKEMAPKAASPGFAAIPVESQQFVYGPWVNYPDLQRHKIFPHLNDSQRLAAIENMIGASHVDYQPDFLPENYGGMYLLDQAASETLESETNYQQRFETGSISIPGLPLFSLGDELSTHGSSINYYVPIDSTCVGYGVLRRKATVNTGPNITNISVQMNRSPETRYTFKTYNSKLNIFNKKNVDNMRQAAQRQQKTRRDFFNQIASLATKNSQQLRMYSTFRDKFYSNANGKEDVTSTASPVEILVGGVYDYAGRITGSTTGVYVTKRSNVGLFDPKEIPRELTSSYSLKSFMSLDGFYSPVSFFPTKWGHTIPYAKFEKTKCPVCNGTKKYKEIRFLAGGVTQGEIDVYCDYCEEEPFYKKKDGNKTPRPPRLPPFILAGGIATTIGGSYGSGGGSPPSPGGGTPSPGEGGGTPSPGGGQSTDPYAPGYVPGGGSAQAVGRVFIQEAGEGQQTTNVAVRESTDGDPSQTVIYEYISDKNLIQNPKNYLKSLSRGGLSSTNINLITLNPIISISGVFRNTVASPKDFCGHSIEVVGRGYVAPPNSLRIPEDIVDGAVVGKNLTGSTRKPRKEDATEQTDLDKIVAKPFLDIDYDSYDMRKLMNNSPIGKIHQLNQRFFSFKGPMVLHGWGYDVDGFPVPNASGNPIASGQYKPHPTTGALWRTRALDVLGSNDMNSPDYGEIIVGQNMVWASGSWSKPYKEKEFLEGWGLRQDNWPVGPIDLRWDESRRVWVAGKDDSYDNVYVTLEEDLILEQNSRHTYPARGFLDDIDFDKEPIPAGTRRVVFVKDRSGYTAPRGAKLYCTYNQNNGFYEPISKPNIMCSGVIKQGLNAEIYANYSEPSTGAIQNVTKISVKFLNNLNFEVKPEHRAMFVYMDGAWNLLSMGKP